jgi:pimeloyl-ACP methyl ester carboxylesterase
MKNKKKLIILIIGLVSIVASLVFSIISNYNSFGGKSISFASTYKEDDVTLKGTYYEKKNAKYAVLICPGYSCDRAKWRPMANAFLANNMSVMTFDYSGQGASYGRIGFDNAKTDEIPKEIDDALEYLHTISNIDYENIILMGHSMGGRSILRLMYDYNIDNATCKLEKKNVKNIILFSPEVNYEHSAQASLFADTNDEEEYPWVNYSPEAIKDTNVYLFGSTADDVVSGYDILRISEKLSGKDAPSERSTCDFVNTNSFGGKITVGVTSGILHSYQMYSYKFASYVNNVILDITGSNSSYPAIFISFVYFSWVFALIGISFTLFSLTYISKTESETELNPYHDEIPTLIDEKSFLLRKLLLWIPGLIMGVIICCICVVLPFGSPVMNIPYMCCIAGYGLTMLFFYRKGKFKGTEGKLPRLSFKVKTNKKNIIECVIVVIGLIAFAWFIFKMTMYNLIPWNIRIFWLVFATILMTAGYYVSGVENDMLKKAHAKIRTAILYNLIQYVALFLFVLFYLIIKSYSGFIGQMQNMLLMYVLTLPLGSYLGRKLDNRFYGALLSSFLFQAMMITSAAIIAIF